VIAEVSEAGEPLDEEARELRLETGAIRNLVQPVRRALPRSPELVDIRGNAQALAAEGLGWGLDDLCGGSKLSEGGELFCEGFHHGQGLLTGGCIIEFQFFLHQHHEIAEAVSFFASLVGMSRIAP
jgi:hypothetical protein